MGKAKIPRAKRKIPLPLRIRSAPSSRRVSKTRHKLSTSLGAPRHDSDTRADGFREGRNRRYTGSGLSRSYSIKTIAEAREVSARTVRRWIETGKLIAHRIDGVVRIDEDDFRAFWALYRGA
jgi:excisionase family DNA binding protein